MSDLPAFHDSHCHALGDEVGGFLIALEGDPRYPGVLDNPAVAALHDPLQGRIAIPYLRRGVEIAGARIKYHPRREGYGPEFVAEDIRHNGRRLVLIDTLDAVRWPPSAYSELAGSLPNVTFVMCHAGGYDILEFVKMCRFLQNVWLDFSATQEIFGWVSGDRSPPFVGDLIDHAFTEPRIAQRVMFGSDTPLFDQRRAVLRMLSDVHDPERFLRANFERLLESVELE